jgi:ketosteroid isomerase-like protein
VQTAESRSLRQAIEAAYERNRQALLSKDPAAVLALRTPDFHVVTPDGATHDAEEMAAFTHNLLSNVERWDALSFEIDSLQERENEAIADVRQHSIRMMRKAEGRIERVENWVKQRETWVLSPEGWKIRRVDNIRDQRVLIDGVERK